MIGKVTIRTATFGPSGHVALDKLTDLIQDMAKDVALQRAKSESVSVTAKDVREAARRVVREL
jgi:hypothetical protein